MQSDDDRIPPHWRKSKWMEWDENEEIREPLPDPPAQAPYRLRLPNADLDGVVADLERLAARYGPEQRQPEIKKVQIVEWENIPDETNRLVDRTQSRALQVLLYPEGDPFKGQPIIDGPTIWLNQVGSAVLLSFTNAYFEEAQPFVLALVEWCREVWSATRLNQTQTKATTKATGTEDSGHYNYPREKRREIVRHLRRDQRAGLVTSKTTWAENNYQITSKTLLKYEREFPEEI